MSKPLRWEIVATDSAADTESRQNGEVVRRGQAYQTSRALVPGGWLVLAGHSNGPASLTFVSDPEHSWNVKLASE